MNPETPGVSPTPREPQKTPLGKILLLIGGSLFLVFLVFHLVIDHRSKVLKESYAQLEEQGTPVFSVLKEHFIKYKKGKRHNIYTYNIADETGETVEVSEEVDPQTYNRLRVGDSILCLRKVVQVSGKRTVISRIKGNTEPPVHFEFLIFFTKFGLYFSGIVIALSFLFWKK